MIQFIPFNEVDLHQNVIVVDCYHPRAFALSHWKGSKVPIELRNDTSTGVVINALEKGIDLKKYQSVTNNHFDIDGFLGVWALQNPEKAIEQKDLLKEAAIIGDFREFNPDNAIADIALALCCWINSVEKSSFYPPFGTIFSKEKEAKRCVSKYEYFLQKFSDVLDHPNDFKADWEDEYNKVYADISLLKEQGDVYNIPGIRMHIVRCPKPIHYYALYSGSENTDMVLSLYDRNRYELEYKYTSWIDMHSRASYPRLDMQPLADQLNQLEKNEGKWDCQKITDTAPVLRIDGNKLNKIERYDHPYKRKIHSSSIMQDELVSLIVNYFESRWDGVERKTNYSWKEIREFNLLSEQ